MTATRIFLVAIFPDELSEALYNAMKLPSIPNVGDKLPFDDEYICTSKVAEDIGKGIQINCIYELRAEVKNA